MSFEQGLIIGLSPVVLGWFGTMAYMLISDHFKNKIHDERYQSLIKEVAALRSMCELNNKIIIARGWSKLEEDL